MQLTNLGYIKRFYPQNPIQRIEYTHQMQQGVAGWRGQVRAFLDSSLVLFAILGILLCLTNSFGLDRTGRPFGVLNIAMTIFVVFVFVQHFVTMIRTLALSSNSIVRERERQSWDLLVLTGIDARSVVRGKWAATVQRQWKQYLFLGVLRAGAAIWWGYNTSSNLNRFLYSNNQNEYTLIPATFWHVLVAVAAILLLTQMNLLYTAAIGVRASVPSERATGALVRGILHRTVGPLALVLGAGLVGTVISWLLLSWGTTTVGGQVITSDSFQEVGFSILNLVSTLLEGYLDNGAALAQGLASTQIQFAEAPNVLFLNTPNNRIPVSVLITLLLLLLYWGLTTVALRNAERLLTHKGNLPNA